MGQSPFAIGVALELRRMGLSVRQCDIVAGMTDILIRNVPDEVVAVLDANAQRAGVTRAEYLRRVLAEQRGRALTR